MPVAPCPNPVNCIDADAPVANLSSEGVDELKCFRYAFGPSSSVVCEFPLTLCQSFASVGGDVGSLCSPPLSIIDGVNPPAPIIYSSSAQSCTVECGPGDFETYTVAAGTFVATAQAVADANAAAFACQLAAMLCTGPLPPLFTNAAQTCNVTCPDNSTVSFTTPASLFTALSQAEANLDAYLFACDVAALLCAGLPPAGRLPGAGVPPTPPRTVLYGNAEQECSATCANGSVFTFTAFGNTFLRESRDAANSVARSFACQQANLRRSCLSDLPGFVCEGEFASEFVEAVGMSGNIVFSISDGALPPGTTLDPSGFFQGVASIVGSYSFQITAINDEGHIIDRLYTIEVGGIDNSPLLPDAASGEDYAVFFTQTGMTEPVTWAIVAGVLPAGLSLDSSSGLLDGTPTEDGDFAFTVLATNGDQSCEKSFSLTVTGVQVQAYWRLEGPPAANHDEITGNLLTYNNFGAVLTSPAAVVGNGLDISGAAFCTFQQQGPTLAYAGPNGFSVALWIRWSSAATGGEGFVYQWDNVGDPGALSWIIGSGEYHFLNLGADLTGNTAIPAADVFHFVVFTYDPADNNLRFSVDGGAFVILGNPGVVTPVADPTAYLVCGNEAVTYDEVQLYSFALRAVDVTYLYNAGAGRVYPPSFPP